MKDKRIYKSFTCDDPSPKGKRKCEAEAAEWAANKDKHQDNTFGHFTLKEAVTSYIDSKKNVLSESTVIGYRVIQRNYMASIEHIALEDFNKQNVQQWVNSLASKASVKTMRNAYGLFSATMMQFMDKRFQVKFPQKQADKISIPSDNDVKKLLQKADGDFKIAISLAAFCGLRRGEICALDRSDVHDGYITISKSMGLTEERTWKIKPPKTESSNRNVNVPDSLLDVLKSKDGRIIDMNPDNITDRFCRLRDDLGMKDFTFHDLRHYYVSVNHALGVPDQYIMAMGGWNTDRTMKAVYRNTLAPERDKFAKISLEHFENMQHEMQHENEKAL
jgi:integrase